jgi:hypothetical protein
MKAKGLLSDAEHSVTRLEYLDLTKSQRRDPVTYKPGQIVKFHRIAKGPSVKGSKKSVKLDFSGKHGPKITNRNSSDFWVFPNL